MIFGYFSTIEDLKEKLSIDQDLSKLVTRQIRLTERMIFEYEGEVEDYKIERLRIKLKQLKLQRREINMCIKRLKEKLE